MCALQRTDCRALNRQCQATVDLLDCERRVVLERVPLKWINLDVSKMKADTDLARVKVAMPGGVTRGNPQASAGSALATLGTRAVMAVTTS